MLKINSIKNIPKRYLIIGSAIVLALILFFALRGNGSLNNRATVTIGTVRESLMVTGKTKPQDSVDLGFNSSGRIAASLVQVGDKVAKGSTLASLESLDLLANLRSAESSLDEEKVKLLEISSNSPQNLSEAKEKVSQALKQAFSLSDGAVRSEADKFFKTPRTNPKFEVTVTDGNYVHYFTVSSDISLNLNNQRSDVEKILNNWQKDISILDPNEVQAKALKALTYMDTIGDFLDRVAFAVNSFESVDYNYISTVNGYKASIESARSNVAMARSGLVTALQTLSSSPISVNGAVSSVSIQEAKVSQAESNVLSIRAALAKASIIAPFDGLITKNDARVGEVATAGTPLISLISDNQMYIEADVSEIKIGRIAIGNDVRVTFDAFPGEQFAGKVYFIEPGETLIDGVPNYKIRVSIDDPEARLKSGLSANLDIVTTEKNNVLAVPVYSLTKEGDTYVAQKVVGGKNVKTNITTGLVGSDGMIEIISGVQEGDVIAY